MKNYLTNRNSSNDNFGLSLFDGFDNFFRPWFDDREFAMKTDVQEKDGNYVLDIDLPGYDKKNIDISLEDGYLEVTATMCSENDEKEKGKFIRRERKCGKVSRAFYVGELKENDIKASYTNGVLNIVFPKEVPQEEPVKKQISID